MVSSDFISSHFQNRWSIVKCVSTSRAALLDLNLSSKTARTTYQECYYWSLGVWGFSLLLALCIKPFGLIQCNAAFYSKCERVPKAVVPLASAHTAQGRWAGPWLQHVLTSSSKILNSRSSFWSLTSCTSCFKRASSASICFICKIKQHIVSTVCSVTWDPPHIDHAGETPESARAPRVWAHPHGISMGRDMWHQWWGHMGLFPRVIVLMWPGTRTG